MKSFMGTALVFVPRGPCPLRRVTDFVRFPLKSEQIAMPKPNSLSIQQRTNVNGNLMLNKYDRSENILQRLKRNKYASDCTNRHFCTSLKIKSFNEPFQPLKNNEPDFCWNCQADLTYHEETSELNNFLTCSKCNVLRQIPKNINHFDLFGMPKCFKMDLKKLAQKYKSMQRILHPDR